MYNLYYQKKMYINQLPSEGGTLILENFCVEFLVSQRKIYQFPQCINYVSHHSCEGVFPYAVG